MNIYYLDCDQGVSGLKQVLCLEFIKEEWRMSN